MATESEISQQLMTGALLHFENGVPINDLDIREEQKRRLARVHHVYMQWLRNPFLDVFQMFKQLIKQGEKRYADLQCEWHAAQRDKWLFDFVLEHIEGSNRRMDEMKVRTAAEQAIRIGMETDNPVALTKGGKLLYELAGLDKPESEKADMSKVVFLPPVVTISARKIDPTKEDQTDEQARQIMAKYGAYVDEKRKAVDDRVDLMLAKRTVNNTGQKETSDNEPDRNKSKHEQ